MPSGLRSASLRQWSNLEYPNHWQLICSVKIELQYGLHLNLNQLLRYHHRIRECIYNIVVFVLKTNIDVPALLSWKPKDLSLSESLRTKLEMIFPMPKPIGLKKTSKPFGGWAEKKWEVVLLNTEVGWYCVSTKESDLPCIFLSHSAQRKMDLEDQSEHDHCALHLSLD